MVGWPDCKWSLSLKIPDDDPAICVACQQTAVLADKQKAVDVRSMAAKDGGGQWGWESGGLALQGHEQAEVLVSGRPAREAIVEKRWWGQ
jgi:hypothetical protein